MWYLADAHILYKFENANNFENTTEVSDTSISAVFQSFPSELYWDKIVYILSGESVWKGNVISILKRAFSV